jgi:hypothetical protein
MILCKLGLKVQPMIEADPLLGNVIANYPSNRARLIIPAAIIIGVVAVVLNFTVAAIDAWWAPPLTVILTGAVSLVVGWPVLHLWNREFVLYDNGFSYREGARTEYFLYPEIKSLRQQGQQLAYFGGLIRRTTFRFTITTIRDERMILTNLYSNIGQLGARLEAKINPILAPQIEAQLSRGEKVPFSHTLYLSQEGLHQDGRDLPWSSFGGYQVRGGRLRLLARPDGNEWFSLSLADVDNIGVLLGLFKQHEKLADATTDVSS